eukprot:g10880.t1
MVAWSHGCKTDGRALRRRCGATALEPLRAEPFDLEAMLAKYEQQEETADEQTDEKAAEAKRPLSSFQVGETVKGRVWEARSVSVICTMGMVLCGAWGGR